MSDYTLVIGSKNYSSWSLRGWLALRMAEVPFEERVITFERADRTEAINAQSPSGLVPVLYHGDLVIPDSLAIAEYIAERHGQAGLWPDDPGARALARSVSCEMHAGFPALRQALPMNVRRSRPGLALSPEVGADIRRIDEIWNACRDTYGAGGPYLFGGFTIADAMFAPVVSRFRTYEVALEGAAQDYMAAVWDTPAMREWAAAAADEPAVEAYDSV